MSWQYGSMTVAKEAPVATTATEPGFAPAAFSGEKKVRFVDGRAVAPAHAPEVVKRAVAAGNRMQRYPYQFGGGHAKLDDRGYDCSGAVSYVLREAGLMSDQMTSTGFLNYGSAGEGEWITVWTQSGHVYMTVGGLRLDTSGAPRSDGPRWKTPQRSSRGFIPRHPAGL